jgi:TrpR-related protein YerC/YecD
MQVSKKSVNKSLEKEVFEILYQTIVDIKTTKEAKLFLEDVLGKNESLVLAKRLAVAYYLANNRSYENIKQNLKVSSATISSIDKARKNLGYKIALQKIEADKWATEWAKRLNNLFGKK